MARRAARLGAQRAVHVRLVGETQLRGDYGEEDEQDNVAVEESRPRLRFGFEQVGKTNYRIEVLPGAGHALGWTPGAGLGPAAAAAISDWLAATVVAGDPRRDGQTPAQAE